RQGRFHAMNLLRHRPVSRYEDDGMQCTYECQACLHITIVTLDPYDIPDQIACTMCGWHEEQDES
ncbi:MAG: hypothetical protein L0J03_16575, partial [Brevibacterium sp.]|nr:hypothetical protein [Brevibacterium sp.]